MTAMFLLLGLFADQHVDKSYSPQHQMPSIEVMPSTDKNFLLLGNIRTHPLIREIQKDSLYTQGWRWTIENESVAEREVHYKDFTPITGRKGDARVYALLSRMPGAKSGQAITILAANHGRAFEGVAEEITSPERLKILLEDDLKWPHEKPLPERFQIFFSVEVNALDEKIQNGATFIDQTGF
jgi:hypothetical protein